MLHSQVQTVNPLRHDPVCSVPSTELIQIRRARSSQIEDGGATIWREPGSLIAPGGKSPGELPGKR